MHRRMLIAWLNDAHAMEIRSLPALRAQVFDARQGIAAQLRRESHLRETEQHAERMRLALKTLGSVPAPAPSSESVMGLANGIIGRLFSDPLANSLIADLAAEQFEIAAYTTLIAAAEHAGEAEVARLCRLNRGEDEDMAEWLDGQIPIVIAQALGRSAAGNG